jgi:hypothetical protein
VEYIRQKHFQQKHFHRIALPLAQNEMESAADLAHGSADTFLLKPNLANAARLCRASAFLILTRFDFPSHLLKSQRDS